MRRLALVPILVTACLFPTAASALGLGDIEMQSALNQRLDAEIPLRGVNPGQADDIIVSLASEKAFQDVGLQRPFFLTRLRFAVQQRDDTYFVHVTSTKPVVEPFLSFLIEVDWPDGNLLREYTVLLDPPVFTTEKSGTKEAAGAAPEAASAGGAETMAGAGVPGEIERQKKEPAAAQQQQETASTAGTEAAAAAPSGAGSGAMSAETDTGSAADQSGAFGDTPLFLAVEQDEERAEKKVAEEQAARQAEREARVKQEAEAQGYEAGQSDSGGSASGEGSGGAPEEYGPVRKGETLWNIATQLKSGDMTVQQMMLALLRYNPEAFSGRNVNRLKQGYVLRVPDDADVRSLSARQAVAQMGEQNAMWREWRQARQGASTTTAQASQAPEVSSGGAGESTASGGDESRLTIVGSDSGGASSDESASATSSASGSTAEQLKLAREQLESARMEKQDLQDRVGELEGTVKKMQRLITLREQKLAELQEQLKQMQQGETGAAASAGGDATAPAGETASGGTESEAAAAEGETAASGSGDSGESTTAAAESESASTGTMDEGSGNEAADETQSSETASAAGSADAAETTDGTAEDTSSDSSDTAQGGETDGGGREQASGGNAQAAPDAGVVTTRTRPPEKTWLDTVTGSASAVVAAVSGVIGGVAAGTGGGLFAGPTSPGVLGAVGLVLLLLVLLAVRRRRAAADGESGDDGPMGGPAPDDDAWGVDEEADLGQMEEGGEMIAEELDAGDSGDGGGRAEAESALLAEDFDFGALDTGEQTAVQQEAEDEEPKDDTVAEADVYLAYGLHQQAEDLLRLALQESPERPDYHEKLLETLYASGKSDEFVSAAEQFQGVVDSPKSRHWQRVVAMGKELAPDNAMFSGAVETDFRPEDLQHRKPATTDIELDAGGTGEVDFGFDESASDSGGPAEEDRFAETLMMDIGDSDAVAGDGGLAGPAEEPSSSRSGEAAAEGADDELEFDLGDLRDLTGGAGESPASTTAESGSSEQSADEGEFEFDLGDLDFGSDLASGSTDSSGDETQARAPAPESTQTVTAGDEDFSLDFDLDDERASASGQEDEPPRAGGGNAGAEEDAGDGGLDLGDLDLGGDMDLGDFGDASDTATGAAGPETDEPEFDLGDFDEDEPEFGASLDDTPAGNQPKATAASSDESAMDSGSDLDFDLDQFGAGEATQGSDDDTLTVGAGFDDDRAASGRDAGGSPGAEEATGDGEDDEFDTMLDLARAYIDMGDAESASNALEEVMSSGSDSQRREAENLLESVR